MYTAIVSAELESDFRLIIELSQKLNFKTKILNDNEEEKFNFLIANESALKEWLSVEENEAWKNL